MLLLVLVYYKLARNKEQRFMRITKQTQLSLHTNKIMEEVKNDCLGLDFTILDAIMHSVLLLDPKCNYCFGFLPAVLNYFLWKLCHDCIIKEKIEVELRNEFVQKFVYWSLLESKRSYLVIRVYLEMKKKFNNRVIIKSDLQ